MPAPRSPVARAEVTGAKKTHPARFVDRSDPQAAPLGEPPEWMADGHLEVWAAFKREIPWLKESDRTLVELATNLRHRLWTDPDMGVQAMGQLRMCVAQMGGTPADRSKVTVSSEGEEDETDRFFQ